MTVATPPIPEQAGRIVDQFEHPTELVHGRDADLGIHRLTRVALPRSTSCLFEGDLNLTGYCRHDRHASCHFSTGPMGHDPWACPGHAWYRCPCPCHDVTTPPEKPVQLDLF